MFRTDHVIGAHVDLYFALMLLVTAVVAMVVMLPTVLVLTLITVGGVIVCWFDDDR